MGRLLFISFGLLIAGTLSSKAHNVAYTIIDSKYSKDTPGFYGWDPSEEEMSICSSAEYKYNRLLYGERQPNDLIFENVNCFNEHYPRNVYNITLSNKDYKITFVNLTISAKSDVAPDLKIIGGGLGQNFMSIQVDGPVNNGLTGYQRVFASME